MKTRTIILISSLILIIVASTACAGSQPVCAGESSVSSAPRLITVTGDADVRVVPDEVVLTLGVETWDEDLEKAKQENDARIKCVMDLARSYEIAPQHIQTDHISIEPRYHDNYERQDFIGFFVRKNVVITLKDTAQFDDLLTDVLGAGVNYVHGIQFRTTELRAHKDQARALAIRAAQEKATALAEELGQSIGAPYTIHENHSNWWSPYNAWWGYRWGSGMAQNVIQEIGDSSATAEESMALGQITVNAKVSVSFELK
jgi:hypothetical protein